MAKQVHEKLAEALAAAKEAAVNNVVRSKSITRPQLTLLRKAGFLKPIIREWYLLDADTGNSDTGTSALWYESYWAFIAQYALEVAGDSYCLSPEQSLDILTGSTVFPRQILIGNTDKVNRVVPLPGQMSLSFYTITSLPATTAEHEGVRLYSLAAALIKVGPSYLRKNVQSISLALQQIDRTQLLAALLEGGHVAAAERLAGAYFAIGMERAGKDLVGAMDAAGFTLRVTNPFDAPAPDISVLRPKYAHAARLELHWQRLVEAVSAQLPPPPSRPTDIDIVLSKVEAVYTQDAYHSLSIEGYKVTPELIERVRAGGWSPDSVKEDRQQRDAMAARGYYEAHLQVKEAIRDLYTGAAEPGGLQERVTNWYRALFAPMVRAGLLSARDLAGYRNRLVFIRGSRHTPMPAESLLDAMDVLFERAQGTEHPLARAILCHWALGYIHPFPDGNGRTARFLMNALLVAEGYPWTIIRIESREAYMAGLEKLSVEQQPDAFIACILAEQEHSASLIGAR